MPMQLLLLDDVDALGRSGEVVAVKPGYARNFLLPQKKAIVASLQTLRLQTRLQEERAKRAAVDKKASEELAAGLAGTILEIVVKVDPEGHLYGSVSAADIVSLFTAKDVEVEKRNILLPQPIKTLGTHNLKLRLKEGVVMDFVLIVKSDIPLPVKAKEEPVPEEQPPQPE